MKSTRFLIVLVFLLSFMNHSKLSFADTETISNRLADLEQQVAILKRQLEIEKEEKEKKHQIHRSSQLPAKMDLASNHPMKVSK